MSYRDDIAALDARVESLRHEAAVKIDELEAAQRLADEARRLVRARVLEAELANPCAASWADMKGDERVRHCGQCRKNVYNFAELTRDEIDALIVEHEGSLCARFFLRADGTIKTKDCSRDLRLRPRGLVVALGAAAVAAGAVIAAGGALVEAHHVAPSVVYDPSMGETVFLHDDPPPEPPVETAQRMSYEEGAGGFSVSSWRALKK
jgi:hypothetical protein